MKNVVSISDLEEASIEVTILKLTEVFDSETWLVSILNPTN